MNRHPGGEAQTLYLLENIEWKKEMKALDLGAGEGDTIRILKSLGMDAHGVDLFPRGSDVETGDFLHLQYPSDSIDLCISQCAFFVSRDQKKMCIRDSNYSTPATEARLKNLKRICTSHSLPEEIRSTPLMKRN